MEEGPIGRTLLLFAVPILFSQLLQELYTIADTMIVGRFVSGTALAAAGEGGTLISIVVNFLVGFSSGISVITSNEFGAREYEKLRSTIWTVNILAVGAGAVLTALTIPAARSYLLLLGCPADILSMATLYLQIRLISLIPQLLYNINSVILRSLGDSATSLYAFFASAVLNIGLDLIFVLVCRWGLAGAGAATVIAQFLLGAFLLYRLGKLDPAYRPGRGTPLLSHKELLHILHIGLPSGFQAFFMSMSSMIVQTVINMFGAPAIAGLSLYSRLEGLLYYPTFSYGLALTSFIGQNLGAGHSERVRSSIRISMITTAAVIFPLSLLLVKASPAFTGLFTDDPEIVYNACRALAVNLPFYVIYALNQDLLGTVKGFGHTFYPMIVTLVSYCLFRSVWCRVMVRFFHSMDVVYWSYNISFIIMAAMLLPLFIRLFRSTRKA